MEGLVNHQILQVHHVKPGPHEFLSDMLFLLSGVLFIVLGLLVTSAFGGGRPMAADLTRKKAKERF